MNQTKLHVAEIYFNAIAYRGYSRVLLARCHSYDEAVAVCKSSARDGYNAYCDFYINKVYKVVFAKSKKCIDDIVAVYVNRSGNGKDLTFVERNN